MEQIKNEWYGRHGYKSFTFDGYTIPMKDDGFDKELETLLKEADDKGLHYKREWIGFDGVECKAATDEEPQKKVLLTASTSDVDSDRDIVLAKGISLARYRKNPVLLWSHNSELPPVGKALWTKVVDGKLKQEAVIAKRPADLPPTVEWFASTIYALIEEGILKGVSIGFLPLNYRDISEKELIANPHWASGRRILDKSLLLEVSFVSMPSNENALCEAVTKGLHKKDHLSELGFDVPMSDPMEYTWTASDLFIPTREVVLTQEQKETNLLKKKCL